MTTLKEYKAMMEGATEGPWVIGEFQDTEMLNQISIKPSIGVAYGNKKTAETNAKFIAASRNIAPELIRVIELAEEAIFQLLKEHDNQSEQWASEALSEIRKLKGK